MEWEGGKKDIKNLMWCKKFNDQKLIKKIIWKKLIKMI